MTRRCNGARALGLTLLLGMAGGDARAHALVIESTPAPGAVLADAPARVVLRFNSRIDHGRSRLTLVGPGGAPGATIALLPEVRSDPAVVAAPCPPLAAGAWRLRWQVLAIDGHITRGDIAFRVER